MSVRPFRHHTLSESSESAVSEMLPAPDPHPDPRPDPSSPPSSPHTTTTTTTTTTTRRPHFCESVYLLPTRLATVLLAVVQGGVLDCYLTHYNSTYWFAWIAGDVAVVMMFAVAFVISYRQMTQVMRRLLTSHSGARESGGEGTGRGACCVGGLSLLGVGPAYKEEGGLVGSPGSMPLVYFAWLVYSCVLAVRALIIYKNFAHQLDHDVVLNQNMLQMTVATSSIVFLLLVSAHHDASPNSSRHHRINHLTFLVVFDLVDASDLLSVLASQSARDAMAPWVTWCVLGVACVNLILPTLPLMALSRTQFGARCLPEFLQTLQRLLVLFGVNAPLLATRLLLWQYVQLPVSTFLVKNVAVCVVVVYSFYERDHHSRLQERLSHAQDVVS